MTSRDRDEIRRIFEENYAENVRSKNRQGYGDMYTEDILWMPPNGPNRCGREDVMDAFDGMVMDQDIDPTFIADEIQVMGDFAYVIGISNATIYPRDGSAPKQALFQALWLMRKDCEQWKIDRQIWNNKPV